MIKAGICSNFNSSLYQKKDSLFISIDRFHKTF